MGSPAVTLRVAEAAGEFKDAAPGHRFSLYFPVWKADWSVESAGKKDALQKCTSFPLDVAALLDSLRMRQSALVAQFPQSYRVEATSIAPFATGLGNEHPVENGFAFLTPYGLPYLAGSGVKGVLRHAAEELALFSDEYEIDPQETPTMLDVWWLFGFEGASGAFWPLTKKEEEKFSEERKRRRALWRSRFREHLSTLANRPDLSEFIRRAMPAGEQRERLLSDPAQLLEALDSRRYKLHSRGALTFWDVFPKPPKSELIVEIMTPHYSDYYEAKRNGATPHDAGQPNPIPFLAVPSGSTFDFHVTCEVHYLPDAVRLRWQQPLLEKIISHAFDWLGFGAKTAVGYGAMREDEDAKKEWVSRIRKIEQSEAIKRESEAATAGLPEDAAWVVLKRRGNDWKNNNGAFLKDCEGYLEGRATISQECHAQLIEEMKYRWRGIMTDPDAVQGRQKKPKFGDRERRLAKRLLQLQPNQALSGAAGEV